VSDEFKNGFFVTKGYYAKMIDPPESVPEQVREMQKVS
jgi:hypothetical protein